MSQQPCLSPSPAVPAETLPYKKTSDLANRLLATLASYQSCVVAFSAGVDSTVVAAAAQRALGSRALAVTGTSASLPAGELDQARELAARIGIRHQIIATDEFNEAAYVQNAPDRCFHCKTELYQRLEHIRLAQGLAVIVNGANVDDLGDYRPGMQAAANYHVRSPLVECQIDKSGVRAIAEYWQLPIWDKPAAPCLSSRVAYGQAVTPERLQMIDKGEAWLRERGFRVARVRYHAGDLARIEVESPQIARLCADPLRGELEAALRAFGWKYVTVDAAGFRSGSQNELLPILG
ncbi:MAG: ATP-dependent sacrificial sulfur transferase LarE [Pirellulales bacterium]|nr:ATP-dependent sacrificial sulfur transferase LarE [Pirellulales bacterium]